MRRSKTTKLSQVLPIWTPTQTLVANLLFQELLLRLGVMDVRSYFHQLRLPIAISVVVCAFHGPTYLGGFTGMVIGGLFGVVAPIALLWVGVIAALAVAYLAIFFAVWAVIVFAFWWLLGW